MAKTSGVWRCRVFTARRSSCPTAGDFRVLPCTACGGILKPDVMFFGEAVPPRRVERALVREAASLLVLGSSLTVMSGLRFVREAAQDGKPVLIVNRDATRGDQHA